MENAEYFDNNHLNFRIGVSMQISMIDIDHHWGKLILKKFLNMFIVYSRLSFTRETAPED